MFVRAWRSWRSKVRFLAPIWRLPEGMVGSRFLLYPELQEAITSARLVAPYEGLSGVWDEYARATSVDYAAYLGYLASVRNVQLRSILDLACGTGIQTARLATLADEVVGVDASTGMLARAKAECSALACVRFVQSDFRNFHLGQRFDAIVCAADSLNYVATHDELVAVFRCVADHLNPGGLFVFDTVTEFGMVRLAGTYLHVGRASPRFAIHFGYEADRRREVSHVLFPNSIEKHVRIPIDRRDVSNAARATGLRVDDVFCSATPLGRLFPTGNEFFVLSREGR